MAALHPRWRAIGAATSPDIEWSGRVIASVFAGRERLMQLLMLNLERELRAETLTELHLWDFTRREEDTRYLRSLEGRPQISLLEGGYRCWSSAACAPSCVPKTGWPQTSHADWGQHSSAADEACRRCPLTPPPQVRPGLYNLLPPLLACGEPRGRGHLDQGGRRHQLHSWAAKLDRCCAGAARRRRGMGVPIHHQQRRPLLVKLASPTSPSYNGSSRPQNALSP